MFVEHFPVAPLGCNCVIVADDESKEAIVIDPGGETDKILKKLAARGLKCTALLHTHTHFDHVSATADVQAATGAPAMIHEGDLPLYQGLQMQLDAFGIPFRAPAPAQIDRFLVDSDTVRAGAVEVGIIHTPGHTPGSLCFYLKGDSPILLAGDTLFQRSVGRSDLWGGSHEELVTSIRKKLFTLPSETTVIAGHGPTTSIGEEKRLNPFVRAT